MQRGRDVHPLPPGRVEAWRTLVERHGAGNVADALLAKWLADPDAADQWANLGAAVFTPAYYRLMEAA